MACDIIAPSPETSTAWYTEIKGRSMLMTSGKISTGSFVCHCCTSFDTGLRRRRANSDMRERKQLEEYLIYKSDSRRLSRRPSSPILGQRAAEDTIPNRVPCSYRCNRVRGTPELTNYPDSCRAVDQTWQPNVPHKQRSTISTSPWCLSRFRFLLYLPLIPVASFCTCIAQWISTTMALPPRWASRHSAGSQRRSESTNITLRRSCNLCRSKRLQQR